MASSVVRRRCGAMLAAAVLLAGCGGSDGPEPEPTAAPPELDTTDVDDDADGDTSPPTSSLEVTGDTPRSEVEIRVGELLSDLDATAEPEGAVVEIPDTVLFDFDAADLRPQASATLDDLVEVLELVPDAPIEIRGHTDGIGDDAYNQRLSSDRADAVATYLEDAGISPDRITTEGVGAAEPIADETGPDGEDDPDGRARNRRVEVVLPTIDLDELSER